jgi:glycerate dehydrogenase
MNKIVFLDRASLVARIRSPDCAHEWIEYPATSPEQVVERLRDATVCITNKVPVRAIDIGQLPAEDDRGGRHRHRQRGPGACRARGIVVSNIRNYSLVSVPEHCFALMLALRRNLRAYCDDVEAGLWPKSERFCLLDHPIADLAGSRLGIVGYGALGRQVAQIGRAFGMQVSVVSRSPVSDPTVNVMTLDACCTAPTSSACTCRSRTDTAT